MIINKLHIENFGKLHNIDLNFNDNLNQIIKENGWGKSTLAMFIKAMFYGMPAKTRGDDFKSERTKYMPWQGGNYGGYIEFRKDDKNYRVTRIFGKSPELDSFELLDLTNNQLIKSETSSLGEELFGIGEESFKMTAFFPQLNFRSNANSELTANLTGVNKYQDDLASIDNAIKKLKEKRLDIKRQIPKKTDIEDKRLALSQLRSYSNTLNSEIDDKERHLVLLQKEQDEANTKVQLEKDKLNLQEERYKDKTLIESKLQSLTSQIAGLYERQSNLQNKTLENLQSTTNSKFRSVYIGLLIFFMLIALASIVLFAVDVIKFYVFLPICLLSVIAMIIIYFQIKRHTKDDKQYQEKLTDSSAKIDDFKAQIDTLNESVAHLKTVLDGYNEVSMPNRDEYDRLRSQQNSANVNVLTLKNQITNLKNDLENNINKEDYLASQIEKMKSDYNDLNYKYTLIDKTIEFLLQAKDNVASRYVSTINSDFSKILHKFNIIENRFLIDNQWNVKEQTSIGTKDYEFSSQGLQDIISFCQRISLIYKIYKKEKPFIILDDTFVNLDDNMMECAREVVSELSKNFQIIYICCNSRCMI